MTEITISVGLNDATTMQQKYQTETYVDIITTDNKVYRLPITKDGGEDGSRPVYHLGDTYAAEITTR